MITTPESISSGMSILGGYGLAVLAALGVVTLIGCKKVSKRSSCGSGWWRALFPILAVFGWVVAPRLWLERAASPSAQPAAATAPREEPAPQAESAESARDDSDDLTGPPPIELGADDPSSGEAEASENTTPPRRPEWIRGELGPNEQRFVAGPFADQTACRGERDTRLWNWVVSEVLGDATRFLPEFGGPGGINVSELIEKEYDEVRQTSVGEVHMLYTLARLDDDDRERLQAALDARVIEARRRRGVEFVFVAGGGSLLLLAIAHVTLRAVGWAAQRRAGA